MSLSWLWQQQGKRDEARELLARRLTTILPAMTLAEALETTRIHRVAGFTGDRTALVTTRPFRAPHHTILDVGLIGGWGPSVLRELGTESERTLRTAAS